MENLEAAQQRAMAGRPKVGAHLHLLRRKDEKCIEEYPAASID
jgi:hypothetical protein